MITLTGDAMLIAKLEEKILEKFSPKDVYGMPIKAKYHKSLRSQLPAVGRETNTLIKLPGFSDYSDFRTPVNQREFGGIDDNCMAKIIGTHAAFEKARDKLEVCHHSPYYVREFYFVYFAVDFRRALKNYGSASPT